MITPAVSEFLLVGGALLLLVVYHLHLWHINRSHPSATAYARNAQTRAVWVEDVMRERRDILAVQTLRNWTMAASFLASTAILIALSILNIALTADKSPEISHLFNFLGNKNEEVRLVKFMALSVDFFFAFFNFTLAIRYYNHVGFMINTGGQKSRVDHTYVIKTLNRGATHYTLGMRGYFLSIPLVLWLFGPTWFFIGSAMLVALLYRIDRTG